MSRWPIGGRDGGDDQQGQWQKERMQSHDEQRLCGWVWDTEETDERVIERSQHVSSEGKRCRCPFQGKHPQYAAVDGGAARLPQKRPRVRKTAAEGQAGPQRRYSGVAALPRAVDSSNERPRR
jgi:hypothetical protein